MIQIVIAVALFLAGAAVAERPEDEWKPVGTSLSTPWTAEVSPGNAWPEYPRPQLVRAEWRNLNGLWDYAVRKRGSDAPNEYDGRILVPFPIESSLSGVGKRVSPDEELWYRRVFEAPVEWNDRRVLLNFGACDWEATAFVNGREIGSHRGGYDPFSFDITDALRREGENELIVRVWDPTDAGTQPRGKQVREPGGIWYTPTTGIWQTVWIEPLAETWIDRLRITPDVDRGRVSVEWNAAATRDGQRVLVTVRERAEAGRRIAFAELDASNGRVQLRVDRARLWSPEDPYLYGLDVQLLEDDRTIDRVESYFAMRKISLAPDEKGVVRIQLNNEPYFMIGTLDQGFWPDGLYAPPTDEALRFDVEKTRELGFNMARKHVKVEPARWYYWCDVLGLLVWQDMPSGDAAVGFGRGEIERTGESAARFEIEWRRIIDALYNHPSIVVWVPFNEGWGQYDTARIAEWTKQLDPTRLVDSASGWNDVGVGDMHDVHVYPGPGAPPSSDDRALVLGEFGGLGLPVRDHLWQARDNWGYRTYETAEALTDAYVDLIEQLRFLIASPGLSAAVYTQTSDVEIEVNGLMTYDRRVVKPDASRIAAANRRLHGPPPRVDVLVPTSRVEAQSWRWTTDEPDGDWTARDFDDSDWPEAVGGFGRPGTPGAVVGTEWTAPDIWLRREFNLPDDFDPAGEEIRLMIHHDEDARVYLNGVLAAELTGYTVAYRPAAIADNAAAALKPGRNTIAIHCTQTTGGQFIDAGLIRIHEPDTE